MSYYYSKIVSSSFEETLENVAELLQNEGFGIITEVDIQKTLKTKLNVDFNRYKILGACNPSLAYNALSLENKIGAMLPCNIIVQQLSDNKIEVAAINPIVSMQSVKNKDLMNLAETVSQKLRNVINNLNNEK